MSTRTANRASRRAEKELSKKHAQRVVLSVWKEPTLLDNGWAIKNADHLKSCSCPMCGNPRRSGWSRAKGKTRKELQKDEQ